MTLLIYSLFNVEGSHDTIKPRNYGYAHKLQSYYCYDTFQLRSYFIVLVAHEKLCYRIFRMYTVKPLMIKHPVHNQYLTSLGSWDTTLLIKDLIQIT